MTTPTGVSRYTVAAFGLTSLAAGLHALLRPLESLASLGLPAAALPAASGNALAALAMGVYYALAAAQDNRAFFLATVPVRLTSAAVFWRRGWAGVAAWEGGGAALTMLALAWDARRGGRGTTS
ncbi:hypothetical protein CTA1_1863 [Colletotrichum tanaceti]|uniref:Integral membrane protein n=1 Tax=Colletotrichum tanaceti TaxID=1306861 RepID=A0A4U6X4U9_9PEZI|nr:hypothetical protein CTA1_1863 [Colletotrichum tanaceti]